MLAKAKGIIEKLKKLNKNIEISPEEFKSIEQFILKQLPAEEYNAFYNNLKTDKILQQKLNQVRLLLLGVQEAALSKKMGHYHQELMGPKKNSHSFSKKAFSMKSWLLAASILVIALVGTLVYFNTGNKEEKLFAQFYKPDPGLITAMSTSDNYLFDRAMINYKTGKYEAAIKKWDSLLITKPKNDTLNYFLGSAYLALNENRKAIAYFHKVNLTDSSYFSKDAYWYLGLALMKENKIQEAIPYIAKSHNPNKKQLLLKLEEE